VICRKLKLAWFMSVLVLAGLISSCQRQRFAKGIVTTTPTSIGSDWVSIPMADQLTAQWDKQMVFVDVSSSFAASYNPLGIRLDDGSIAAPEAELISQQGQKQPLRLVGLISGHQVQFSGDQIPRGTSFSELRIRSPRDLNCSRITWLSYMPHDSKYSKDTSN
jgi:hypothetical protein